MCSEKKTDTAWRLEGKREAAQRQTGEQLLRKKENKMYGKSGRKPKGHPEF